jgi:organic hydroperoxide reductase OsmC/OhrA
MLFFLAIADAQGYRVKTYRDHAVGYLEAGANGVTSITRIELSPEIAFAGDRIPDSAALDGIHARAHKKCFISNSINAKVTIKAAAAAA